MLQCLCTQTAVQNFDSRHSSSWTACVSRPAKHCFLGISTCGLIIFSVNILFYILNYFTQVLLTCHRYCDPFSHLNILGFWNWVQDGGLISFCNLSVHLRLRAFTIALLACFLNPYQSIKSHNDREYHHHNVHWTMASSSIWWQCLLSDCLLTFTFKNRLLLLLSTYM